MNDQRFFLVTRPDGWRTYIRIDAIDRIAVISDRVDLVCGNEVIQVTSDDERNVIIAALGEMIVKSP